MTTASIAVTAAASTYPVTVEELKSHARIVETEEESWLETVISTAVAHTETEINAKLITQTVTWKLDWGLPSVFCIPVGPLVSVTSINYIDGAGDSQLLASDQYVVDASDKPGRIYPAFDVSWPSTRFVENAVTVVYVAGYGAATAVPAPIRHAILMLAGHLNEHREAYLNSNFAITEVPRGYVSLLSPYKEWLL